MMTNMTVHPRETVRAAAEAATGARFSMEHTGGGCWALTATLEGGLIVVLCDGNLAADFDYPGTYLQVAVFTHKAWHDGEDALADASTIDLSDVHNVVDTAVRATVATLRDL